jgi:CheY-like chemotaxis protein
MGIAVDAANTGVEAVEAVQSRDYDLVLMDVHMPDMDGIAATEAIRRLAGPKAKIPIVALTANVLQADIDRCYEAGMNDFISKPFRKAQLLATIVRRLPQTEPEKAVA